MGKDKIDELEKKKRQLEEELERIQNVLDDSIIRVRSDISSHLDPRTFIRKHPLPVVGTSVLLGFLVGFKGRRNGSSSDSGGATGEIGRTLFSELKKLATKRAVSFATGYLENILSEKRDEQKPSGKNNGSPEE